MYIHIHTYYIFTYVNADTDGVCAYLILFKINMKELESNDPHNQQAWCEEE